MRDAAEIVTANRLDVKPPKRERIEETLGEAGVKVCGCEIVITRLRCVFIDIDRRDGSRGWH